MPGGRSRPKRPPKKNGAPSPYSAAEHPQAARVMAGNGKTHANMAEVFGLERHTISDWINRHPEFAAAIALGKEDACDRAERALFERATGYTFPSEKIVIVSGGQGMGSGVERVPIMEHVPPDPVSLKFYLVNRRGKAWRDKTDVSVELVDRAALLGEADARVAAGTTCPPPSTQP